MWEQTVFGTLSLSLLYPNPSGLSRGRPDNLFCRNLDKTVRLCYNKQHERTEKHMVVCNGGLILLPRLLFLQEGGDVMSLLEVLELLNFICKIIQIMQHDDRKGK